MGWWKALWVKRAETWTYEPLVAANVPGAAPSETITPDSAYVQVRLKSMHIRDVRRGLSRFYGTVHSFASIPHRGGKPAEFHALTTPGALRDVDAKNIDRVIGVDFPLLGPVPYRGGEFALQVGLFSIKSENLAEPFLDLLGTLSTLGGVAFVGTAQAFAKPLTQGIDLLTGGADDTVLEIGLSAQTRQPQTGYYAVIRVPSGTLDVQKLRVNGSSFALLDERGNPVSQYPYMVLAITASLTRDDWFLLPELQKPYAELQASVRAGKPDEVKIALIAFERTVLTSDDLLLKDAKTLAAKVRKETEDLFPVAPTRADSGRELKPLKEIDVFA
jgi:hypothetical protein